MLKAQGILTFLSAKSNSNPHFLKLIELLYNYYEVDDIRHNTNNAMIFKTLFLSSHKNANEIVAVENFISVRTLYRYLKDMNDLALKICKKYYNRFGFLLAEYEKLKRKKTHKIDR